MALERELDPSMFDVRTSAKYSQRMCVKELFDDYILREYQHDAIAFVREKLAKRIACDLINSDLITITAFKRYEDVKIEARAQIFVAPSEELVHVDQNCVLIRDQVFNKDEIEAALIEMYPEKFI